MPKTIVSSSIDSSKKGTRAELLVKNHLLNNGFEILALNYRKRFGEIDVIALKRELLIFIEVKYRSKNFLYHADLVLKAKQKRITKTALDYIATNNIQNKILRFDIVLVENIDDKNPKLTYYENAFSASNEF